jgi:hypothetical protein
MTPPPMIPNEDAETVTQAPVVETTETHLSRQENELIKELLRPGVSIEAVIPSDASAEDLWRTLDACSRGLKLLEARTLRLRPIIGHLLRIFEGKPSLYHELGYESYADFMSRGVYKLLGLRRTSAYDARLAARWPQITADRYVKIGPKKLAIVSQIVTPTSPNAEALLQVAERMKLPEFKEYTVQRGMLREGEHTGATITITTNRAIYSHWREFFSDPRVHKRVGSKDFGEILESMIQECSGEWLQDDDES